MPEYLSYDEQVKHFNVVMSRALAKSPPLRLADLEIKVLSNHLTMQQNGLKIPEHEHPNFELSFMEAGEMTTWCEDCQITCNTSNHNILFIPPATLHHRVFGNYDMNINMTLVFTISGRDIDANLLCSTLSRLAAAKGYCLKMPPVMANIIQEMRRQTESDMVLTEVAGVHLLYSLLTMFFQQNFPELFEESNKTKLLDQFDFENNRIEAIKRMLVILLNSRNPLKQLSEGFGVSERHLNRIFKQETGMTITSYQSEMKLAHARNLLGGTNVSISEIAHTLGFSSPVRFSCFFRQHEGCSPSHFRHANKSNSKWQ